MERGFFVLEKVGIPHSENLYFPKYQNIDFQGDNPTFLKTKTPPPHFLME